MQMMDWVILLLTFIVAAVVGGSMANVVINDVPYDVTRAEIIGGLTVGIISIISIYVTSKLKRKKDNDNE